MEYASLLASLTDIEDVVAQELSIKTHPSMTQDSEIFYAGNRCYVRRYDVSENKESISYVRYRKRNHRSNTYGKKISKSIKWTKPLPEIKIN